MKLGYGNKKAEKVIEVIGCREKCEKEGTEEAACECADDKDFKFLSKSK